jgi:hypothetical protein
MERQEFYSWRIGKRFIAGLLLAILHLAVSVGLSIVVFTHGMASFDDPTPQSSLSMAFDIAGLIFVMILWAPIGIIGGAWPSLVLNSLLWGFVLQHFIASLGHRSSWRFGLRTALIVVTVIAVALALFYQFR